MNDVNVVKSEYDRVFQDIETQEAIYINFEERLYDKFQVAIIQQFLHTVKLVLEKLIRCLAQIGMMKNTKDLHENGFENNGQKTEFLQTGNISQQGVIPRSITDLFEK